jgi:putative endonuclease
LFFLFLGMRTYVYLLASASVPGTTYIGVTNDLARRLRQHNGEIAGGARFTRRARPWCFAAVFAVSTRRAALQLEYRAKRARRRAGETRAAVIARVAHALGGAGSATRVL